MTPCVLLAAFILTAHALAALQAPSGEAASSLSGSGQTPPDVERVTTRKDEEQDHGYQRKGTLKSSSHDDEEAITELRYDEDELTAGSTPDGNVTSLLRRSDEETHDNATSGGVGCQGNSRQPSLASSRRHWLEAIKSDIWSQLGRKSPIDVARSIPPIPEVHHWIDLVETGNELHAHAWDRNGAGSEEVSAKILTVVAFPSSTAPNSSGRLRSGAPIIQFRLNGTTFPASTRLSKATLGVFVRRSGSLDPAIGRRSRRQSTSIQVYRLGSAARRLGHDPSLQLVWTREIQVTWAETGRWYHFDALRVVEQWLEDPERMDSLGFVITAMDSRKTELVLLSAADDYERRYLPYLEIAISDSASSRLEKRSLVVDDCDPTADLLPSTSYTSPKKRRHHCCRHPLVIDFRSFGWNWIIAPQRYNAYFCSGICPRFRQTSSGSRSVHSHLLEQAGPAGYHGLCCAPASRASISIIFFDDQGRILFRKIPDMVVTSCSCV